MNRNGLLAACGVLAATIALEATAIDPIAPGVAAPNAAASLPGRPPRLEQRGRRDLAAQKKPRLFPPTDLGLLEAPDREQWQKPDLIMDALKIGEGDVVADLGAGGGWFTVHLARRVWPNGIVYAEDVQSPMVEVLTQRIQREGLRNVRPVLGIETDPKLPIGLDAVLMVEVFHEGQLSRAPGGIVTLLKNVARSLKPQGLVGVVDFLPGDGGPGPSADERNDPEAVIRVVQQAGLVLKAREAVPPFQYLLVFGKGPQPSAQH
jgi:SAM-dependent methyltransferase